jgi:phosphoribosylamine-glycine ligase
VNLHRVLLACGSDWQAPARLPKLFKRAACHVTVFASPEWGIAKTKHIDETISAPTELSEYVDALGAHLTANTRKYGWIVAVDDPLLEALVARKGEPWTRELLPLAPESDFFGLLASKAEFAEAAPKLNLSVPESYVCDSLDEAILAAKILSYPLVVKLACSYAGMGVRRAGDEAELRAAWAELRAERRVVLQSFVEGRLGNTAALFSKGRVLASMSAFKSRTWPGAFGPSSARQFMHDESIDALLESFGAQTHYDGFCAFDWILDDARGVKVIELNARPVPALHMAAYVGVDFSQAIADFLRVRNGVNDHRVRSQRPSSTRTEAVFPMFPEDFHRAIAEADGPGLARFRRGQLGFDDIPWDDDPLLAHVLRRRATRRAFEQLFDAAARGTSAPREAHDGDRQPLLTPRL